MNDEYVIRIHFEYIWQGLTDICIITIEEYPLKINKFWIISFFRLPSSSSPTSVRSEKGKENTQDKSNSPLKELSCSKLKYINMEENYSTNIWLSYLLQFHNQFSDECDY